MEKKQEIWKAHLEKKNRKRREYLRNMEHRRSLETGMMVRDINGRRFTYVREESGDTVLVSPGFPPTDNKPLVLLKKKAGEIFHDLDWLEAERKAREECPMEMRSLLGSGDKTPH